jgi:hypothetical protein
MKLVSCGREQLNSELTDTNPFLSSFFFAISFVTVQLDPYMHLIFDKEAHGSTAYSNVPSAFLSGEEGDCLDLSIKMLLLLLLFVFY